MIRARTIVSIAAIALLLGDGAFALLLTATATPRPATLTIAGDLDPLTLAGADRWTTANGSVHIAPNADVAGSSFFLAVALNLTVQYQDGSSYATSGWEPDARTTFFDIRTDVAPFGAVALAAGSLGAAIIVVSSRRGRRPASDASPVCPPP